MLPVRTSSDVATIVVSRRQSQVQRVQVWVRSQGSSKNGLGSQELAKEHPSIYSSIYTGTVRIRATVQVLMKKYESGTTDCENYGLRTVEAAGYKYTYRKHKRRDMGIVG